MANLENAELKTSAENPKAVEKTFLATKNDIVESDSVRSEDPSKLGSDSVKKNVIGEIQEDSKSLPDIETKQDHSIVELKIVFYINT